MAARLFEVKVERETLRSDLKETTESLITTRASEERLSAELAEQRESNARVVGDMRNAQAALLNDAKRQVLLSCLTCLGYSLHISFSMFCCEARAWSVSAIVLPIF